MDISHSTLNRPHILLVCRLCRRCIRNGTAFYGKELDDMAGKPSTQFYPGDWWRSVDLRKCCMSTQGIWFNLLLVMWDEKEQGKIVASRHEIVSILGCKLKEINRFFVDLKRHNFAELIEDEKGNGDVTIINRRMYSAFKAREATKRRVSKHRGKSCNADVTDSENAECNANVTPPSSTSSSTSNNINNNNRVTYNVTSSSEKDSISPSLQEVLDIAPLLGMPEDKAKEWYEHYQPQGFIFGNGLPIKELRGAMVRWKNNHYRSWKNWSNQRNEKRTTPKRDFGNQESEYGETIDV